MRFENNEILISALACICIFLSGCATAPITSPQAQHADYARAEMFLPWNMEKMIQHERVVPVWIDDTRFWYKDDTRRGEVFWLVNIRDKTRQVAFDHEKLAARLSEALGENVEPYSLPINDIKFETGDNVVEFTAKEQRWQLQLADYSLEQRPIKKAAYSPDGKWEAFIRGHNLWVRAVKTNKEIQLSYDGEEDNAYATPVINPRHMIAQGTESPQLEPDVYWSRDSRKILTYKMNKRGSSSLSLVQTRPYHKGRSSTYRYFYPLSGDETVPHAEAFVFHMHDKKRVKLDFPPYLRLYYGAPHYQWYDDSRRIVFMLPDRGYQRFRLFEADAYTGAARTVIDEKSDNFLDYYTHSWYQIAEGKTYLWASERDGWNHLYHYDGQTGQLLNRVTQGAWRFRDVLYTDAEKGVVFFIAGGREPERDPYLRHLYRVNLDGSELKLLTPEPFDHDVYISPAGNYIVDNYSRVDVPATTVIRRSSDGEIIMTLQKTDITELLAKNFVIPEPFSVKAADGETDIYGTIYRPSNFNPEKNYPVIDNIYTGPHHVMARKSFFDYRYTVAQSVAEVGFIVVHIDGRGTSKRSKAFHQHAYKNLGAAGLDDHERAIRQLAERYPYMDTTRVGVFGFSAGGYDTARALFRKPDFYKVGVAAAGNHDLRMDKAVWNEQWMGYPMGPEYERDSNMNWAPQLKGKLLIAHGELDENVNPMNTLQLADALIKANKDFDMLIMPGEGHSFSVRSLYFQRVRWDYFVRHLLGVEPPKEYTFQME